MALGYAIGSFFVGPSPARPRRLLLIGTIMTLSFLSLRLIHLYGDPVAWAPRPSMTATILCYRTQGDARYKKIVPHLVEGDGDNLGRVGHGKAIP